MRANRNKLELAMAKACMNTADLQKAAENAATNSK